MKHAAALPCLVTAVVALAACTKDEPRADPSPSTTAAPAATQDATPCATPPREAVVFSGAPGWSGGRSCTDVRPEDGCDSQWLRTAPDGNGQVVRVFIVDVKEERALDTFVDKLAADVANKGGVVDRFTQQGLTLVRFLQPVKDDEGMSLASINYALVGRDKKAVHLVTSVVAFDEQQAADVRLRELLSSAAWTPR